MAFSADISTRAGSRIRERRREIGLSQAALARQVEISASYLNLIEHNRRRIGGKLLLDIAQALTIAPQFLSEGAEVAKIEGLQTAAARAREIEVEAGHAQDLAERFPGWTNLLLDQAERIERLEDTVAKLSDRLTHDPHLAASLHEMVSTVTAIRSSAAILKDTPDLEPQWRERFQRNVFEESERLVQGSQRLASYLDGSTGQSPRQRAPQDEFQHFLRTCNYRFPMLTGPDPSTPEDIVAQATTLTSNPARALALTHLNRCRREAEALPADRLTKALEETGADPVRASGRLGLPLALVLRRIAAVPNRQGAPEPGLAICDGSGALSYAKPAEGFEVSLLGHACPLWPLYQSLLRPMTPLSRAVELPGTAGARFLTWSVAEQSWPEGLDGPPVVEATMLILPATETDEAPLPIGMACAVCPRHGCPGRHEPSILSSGL